MTTLQIENKVDGTAQALRLANLKDGYPFVINSVDLPVNFCYLEYPNGTISLATFKRNDRQYTIIRNLTVVETKNVRLKFNLN